MAKQTGTQTLPGLSPNPKRFREMLEPYESPEAAEQCLTEFFQAVEQLRVDFKVAEVLVVVRANVAYPQAEHDEQDEGAVLTYSHFGDQLHAESMAAWAFGQLQLLRQELIATRLSPGIKSKRKGHTQSD